MNDFGCRHSEFVQGYFDVCSRGVDYINDFGTRFEFKESWRKDIKEMFFKVPKHQLENSDYIIFFVYDKEFYVHSSDHILRKYAFDNKSEHCCLRYSTIRKNFIRRFMSYGPLKAFVNARDLK